MTPRAHAHIYKDNPEKIIQIMKIQNVYLFLAAVCAVLLCCFSPVYFSSEEDANHYFTMDFASINARTYDAEGALVIDDNFRYATVDDNGVEVETQTGAAIMSVWAMPVLAILMGLISLVVLVWGFFATKVKHLLLQANLNIFTLICALGYYAMLALYVFFAVNRFDFDWHMAWPVCLPLVVIILTLMSMRAFSNNAKKIRHDLSGSIR